MKTRLILALIVVWFTIGTAVAIGKGWPNHGIAAPGQPNHYASPHPIEHP